MLRTFPRLLATVLVLTSCFSQPAAAGLDSAARGLAAKAASTLSQPVTQAAISTNYVAAAVGDSLTAGNQDGSGVTYPNVFAGLSNYQVVNFGVGGQTSLQIAERMGGTAFTLTVSGNALSAGVANSVTAINGAAISAGTAPLSVGADSVQRTLTGTLCGVHGRLVRTVSAGEVYSFYTDGAGAAASCPAASTFTNDNTAVLQNSAVLIWIGRNNFSNAAQVESDIASTVATIGHKNYLILGVINGAYPGEWVGQTSYNQIIALDTFLSATYGAHYLDARAALIAAYNPANGVDAADVANGVPPYSLRALNLAGTLTSSVGTTGCPAFTVTTGYQPQVGNTVLVDSEYIVVRNFSGGVATNCTRGYGSVAASHSAGASWVSPDPLHLGSAGYTALANAINAKISSLRTTSGILSTSNVGDTAKTLFASPRPIGSTTPSTAAFTALFDQGYAYSQPATGATVTVADSQDAALIDPAATLAALTVQLPTCSYPSYDGKVVRFSTTQALTALTVSASAGSVAGGYPTTAVAGQGFGYLCRAANATWYRLY